MRFIISAIGAVLVLSSVNPTASVAQTTAQGSMSQVYNSCVELARQRGWSESDIEVSRRELRNFVARCIQGREARAQKQQKQRR
jgi:ABC-type antimicrobial peptide transport system permease subunit